MTNTIDPTPEEMELFDFMANSKTAKEWNDNADIIKKKHNGYPDYWYKTCIQSGLLYLLSKQTTWNT